MKRKGRQHLPKVGTPANRDAALHERREHALHPFSDDPDTRRGPSSTVIAIVIAVVAVITVIGLIAITA